MFLRVLIHTILGKLTINMCVTGGKPKETAIMAYSDL